MIGEYAGDIMEDKDRENLVKGYIDCYNSFDIEGMLAFLADSIVFENVSSGEIDARANGKTEFKGLAESSARLFSHRKQDVTRIEVDGEKLIAHISYKGTLATDLPNGLKAGQTLELAGRSEFEFVDGKISCIRDIS